MRIPYYKAIDKETNREVEGFYFEYPETTYAFKSDGPIKVISCLCSYRITDWGLPNIPTLCNSIDKSTLKQIGWIDTKQDYFTEIIPLEGDK
jgi:hypothetical protein